MDRNQPFLIRAGDCDYFDTRIGYTLRLHQAKYRDRAFLNVSNGYAGAARARDKNTLVLR